MTRVLMIGGGLDTIRYARELGVDVVLVHEPGRYGPEFVPYCEKVVHAPVADPDAIIAVAASLHRERPFERVLSPTEDGLVAAAQVGELLGVPGNSVVSVLALKNKLLGRQAMAKHAISPVRFQLVRDAAGAAAFATELGGRLVLKPVDGAATKDVHVADGVEGVLAAWKTLQAAGYREILAEEYLGGPEVSVESFSLDGRHLTVGINEKTLNEHLVEVGHTMPSRVTGPYEAELRAMTAQFLDAVGLVEGPSHTEFVITRNGPRILESHNRIGGGGSRAILRRVYGMDFSRMTLSIPLGLEQLPAQSPSPEGGAAIRFFEPLPGVITRIAGLDEVGAPVRRVAPGEPLYGIPGLDDLFGSQVGVQIQMNEGDQVPVIKTGYDRRMGYVIASGVDADEAEARCASVLKTIVFQTE